jgi:uncharacterized phiE125 gp8 family phage protein
MAAGGAAEPIVTLAQAQAFARIETGEEEAICAGLIRSASALCEAFIGQVVIERPFAEQLPASAEWQRLNTVPVRSIDDIMHNNSPLASTAYATDIDPQGYGWVRVTDPAVKGTIEIIGRAGMATSQNGVPEPIRQGVLRLVAHLFTARDGHGGEIPAAVTALWRPYRRMRLA